MPAAMIDTLRCFFIIGFGEQGDGFSPCSLDLKEGVKMHKYFGVCGGVLRPPLSDGRRKTKVCDIHIFILDVFFFFVKIAVWAEVAHFPRLLCVLPMLTGVLHRQITQKGVFYGRYIGCEICVL